MTATCRHLATGAVGVATLAVGTSIILVIVSVMCVRRAQRKARPKDVHRRVDVTVGSPMQFCEGEPAIACPECDRQTGLTVVGVDRGREGFAAWVECPCGHQINHHAITYPRVLVLAESLGLAKRGSW